MNENWVDIHASGVLPLGMARLDNHGAGQTALLGVTLKHVASELSCRLAPRLAVTGGRAPLAVAQAERFYRHFGQPPSAEIQIEWAIPVALGLGSEPILGLSVARALAELHGLPAASAPALAAAVGLGAEYALETWAFERGGMLLVSSDKGPVGGGLAEPLAHHHFAADDRNSWALVMFHPNAPEGTPAGLEAERAAALRAAAPRLPLETGRLVRLEIWPALESGDIARFGKALLTLQDLNRAALDLSGGDVFVVPGEQEVFDLFSATGAFAWGRSATGLALFGLVQGRAAAGELKKGLLALKGHFSGTTMATALGGEGARTSSREARSDGLRAAVT